MTDDSEIKPMVDRLRFGINLFASKRWIDLNGTDPIYSHRTPYWAIMPLPPVKTDYFRFGPEYATTKYNDFYVYEQSRWDCMTKCVPPSQLNQIWLPEECYEKCSTLYPETKYPEASIYDGTLDFAIQTGPSGCSIETEPAMPDKDLLDAEVWLMDRCYMFGKINIVAGVARKAAGGNVTSKHTIDIIRPKDLQPDQWVDQTFKTFTGGPR
jgi:hypothetical protein